jgi:ribosomal protein S18 acetylase RimI-like enzyme
MISKEIVERGSFSAHDKSGVSVVLEWVKTDMMAPEFAALMANAWEVARPTYTAVEMQFLKAHPEVVSQDDYFKSFQQSFKDLFSNGPQAVDWQAAQEHMETVLKQAFVFDTSRFSEELIKKFSQDQYFFVSVKDKESGAILGFVTFLIRPGYAAGDIKVSTLAVAPSAQKRGLATLLMSSIFKLHPSLKRIFLCTRVTNETAIRAYKSWGFTHDTNPVQEPHYTFNLNHWIFMEYKADQEDVLQKVAEEFDLMVSNQTVKAGSFLAHDKVGVSVVLEWVKIEGQSPKLNETIKEVSAILAHAYTRQELDFARQYPQAVPTEFFLKSLVPLFAEGVEKVDWQKAEQQLFQIFNTLFTSTDFSQYTKPHDVSYFVIAKDQKSNELLGVIQFLRTGEFETGNVKSAYFGIAPAAQDRGLEKLLMSSVFALTPDAKRIFMHTRITNNALISLYKSWGFEQFPGPLPYWIDLEYKADQSDVLQKIARNLV